MRLIDADKLIKKTQEYIDEWNGWEDTRGGMRIIQEVIREMPTIEAEPVRHGKWKYIHFKAYKETEFGIYQCSVCGRPWWLTTKYCPHCGAKMEQEESDEADL